jgi:NlpC/P60 family putative phage cell wall peptidase
MTEKATLSGAELIVSTARQWVGTPFRHQGRRQSLPGQPGGCDCLGLLIGIAQELGLTVCYRGEMVPLASLDSRSYSRLPRGEPLRQMLERYLIPVPSTELRPADAGLFLFEGAPRHLGLFGEGEEGELTLIHAYAPAGGVVEHRFTPDWRQRLVAAYRLVDG